MGEFDATLSSIFMEGEKVFRTFDVLALDYRVKDLTRTRIIITTQKLLLLYDDVIEVYILNDLDLSFNEVIPSFEIQGLLLEGNFDLSNNLEQKVLDIRRLENRVIFSFNEENLVKKDLILRKEYKLETNFRTWAMGQTIINTKNGVMNRGLDEMLTGYFGTLESSSIIKFIAIFVIYFILKIVTVNLFGGIINTLVDIVFWIVLAFALYTIYKTGKSTLKRFENMYLSYNS